MSNIKIDKVRCSCCLDGEGTYYVELASAKALLCKHCVVELRDKLNTLIAEDILPNKCILNE